MKKAKHTFSYSILNTRYRILFPLYSSHVLLRKKEKGREVSAKSHAQAHRWLHHRRCYQFDRRKESTPGTAKASLRGRCGGMKK